GLHRNDGVLPSGLSGRAEGLVARDVRLDLLRFLDSDGDIGTRGGAAHRSILGGFAAADLPHSARLCLSRPRVCRGVVVGRRLHGPHGFVLRDVVDAVRRALARGLRHQEPGRDPCADHRAHGVRDGDGSGVDGLSDRPRRKLSAADSGDGSLLLSRLRAHGCRFQVAPRPRLVSIGSFGYLAPMTVTVRFAPSPTGRIHIGNARTALFNWLFARQRGGRFILRFDDTDAERSKREYADAIERDLEWLGIRPDALCRQSERTALYDEAVERLKRQGRLYACYETPEELELKRKVRLSRKLPPVYGREALKLALDARRALEAAGRRPHWRFLLPNFGSDPFSPQ